MTQSPHFFIGIPMNQELKEQLTGWQSFLKSDLEHHYQSWTHPDDFHITLKFLGEGKSENISLVKKELNKVEMPQSFHINIGEIGTFGKPRKPRVLWAGVEKSSPLQELQKQVETACTRAGFLPDNKPYRPHVTLAKKWKGEKLSKDWFDQLIKEVQQTKELRVDYLSLFRVHPSKSPKYEEITRIKLI